MKPPNEPISDEEFLRLYQLYSERTNPNRRALPRVERPINIKSSVAGGRIVTWQQYLEAQGRGEAKAPVGSIKWLSNRE